MTKDVRFLIEQALKQFMIGTPRESAKNLLSALGYQSDKTV